MTPDDAAPPPAAGDPVSSDRAAAGQATFARNFDVPLGRAHALLAERVGAQFTQEVFEVAGGPGWQSPALTDRDRSIAIIAALVTLNVTDDRLSTYLSLARRHGVDDDGLSALMALLMAYVGQPYASRAMETVRRTDQSHGDTHG